MCALDAGESFVVRATASPSASSRRCAGAGSSNATRPSRRSARRPRWTRVADGPIWTVTCPRILRRVPDSSPQRGLVDTSVVIGLERIDPKALPEQLAIAAITLAELVAGPPATREASERARRQQRLQLAEATFGSLPFDTDCTRAYGLVYAETVRAGRKARGAPAIDLIIAATALAANLSLYTAGATEFSAVSKLIDLRPVSLAPA